MSDPIHLKYLAVNEQDMLWNTAVNSVGGQEIAPGMSYPPSNHPTRYIFTPEGGRVLDEYQFVYIYEGEGKFFSRNPDKAVDVRAGSMILLFPGVWHSYRPNPATGWKEYWIGFRSGEMDKKVENGFFSKKHPVLSVGIRDTLVDVYKSAINVAGKQESGFQQLLSSMVSYISGLAYYYDRNRSMFSSKVSDVVSRAKIIVSEQSRTITPEELAARMCMGYSSFRKVFKEYTGFAPAKYIQSVRFNRAKEDLTNTDKSVKEIAYEMGYDDYEYFFTAFRRNTGMTPKEYRNFTRNKQK